MGAATSPAWNHNGRRDLFDRFMDYVIINCSDDNLRKACCVCF